MLRPLELPTEILLLFCDEYTLRNVEQRVTLKILMFHCAFQFIECYTPTNAFSIQ